MNRCNSDIGFVNLLTTDIEKITKIQENMLKVKNDSKFEYINTYLLMSPFCPVFQVSSKYGQCE